MKSRRLAGEDIVPPEEGLARRIFNPSREDPVLFGREIKPASAAPISLGTSFY
jgi:hypothetical protein